MIKLTIFVKATSWNAPGDSSKGISITISSGRTSLNALMMLSHNIFFCRSVNSSLIITAADLNVPGGAQNNLFYLNQQISQIHTFVLLISTQSSYSCSYRDSHWSSDLKVMFSINNCNQHSQNRKLAIADRKVATPTTPAAFKLDVTVTRSSWFSETIAIAFINSFVLTGMFCKIFKNCEICRIFLKIITLITQFIVLGQLTAAPLCET